MVITIGKFIFLVDFVVLDIDKWDVSLTLGRSFLSTSQTIIDFIISKRNFMFIPLSKSQPIMRKKSKS